MFPKTITTRRETKSRKEKSLSCFLNSESAAATAIAAVLLLGLVFTIISVVKLEYVPEWKNDAEMNHMHDTWNDMVGVKTSIDIFSKLTNSNNYLSRSISITGPVNMGGGDIPFLEPSKSNGKLDVNTERYAMTVVPRSLSQKIEPDNFTLECGGITCYPENRQYLNQIFRYENGALILADGKSSLMRQPPAITIEEDETDKSKCTVIIKAVQISGKRDSTSSNTIIPLQLTGYKTEPVYDSTGSSIAAFNLTIATKYPDAWITYFNKIAQDNGLRYGKDYTVQYLQGSGHVRFSFLPNGDKTLEGLYVSKATIGAGLGTESNFDYNLIRSVMKLKQWYCFDTFTGTHNGIALSASPDPSIFKDYDTSKSPLPSGNSPGVNLIPYSLQNEFSEHLNNNDNLDLIFKFNNYGTFDVSPKQATILMIHKYDNDDPKKYKEPTMEMSLSGQKIPSINQLPAGNWKLYSSNPISVSPTSPSDLTFNLKVIEGNNGQGTFHIDYLAIYLS
jgi:hypothetical protein